MLDWGAILLSEFKNTPVGNAGAGYSAFALAMTIARIVGDRLVAKPGHKAILALDSLLTAIGIALAAGADDGWLSVAGFAVARIAFTQHQRMRCWASGERSFQMLVRRGAVRLAPGCNWREGSEAVIMCVSGVGRIVRSGACGMRAHV